MISPGERTACDVEPILPVTLLDWLIEIPRSYAVEGTDLLNLFFGPVRDAFADKKFPPLRRRWRKAPRAKRGLKAVVRNFMPIHGLDHLGR